MRCMSLHVFQGVFDARLGHVLPKEEHPRRAFASATIQRENVFAPALRKRRATSGHLGRINFPPASGLCPRQNRPAGPPVRIYRQGTRTDAFLRNLSTITRNGGGVNAFGHRPRNFQGAIRSSAASRPRLPAKSRPGACCSTCFRGCARCSAMGPARQ